MPTPTPYPYQIKMLMPGGAMIDAIPLRVNNIPYALAYKESGGIIAEKPFVFSDEIRDINERKKNGEDYKYQTPYAVFKPKSLK